MVKSKNTGEEKETADDSNSKDSSKFWQKIADEEFSNRKKNDKPDNSVLGQFLNPLIPPVVHVMPVIPSAAQGNNTACFDFRDNQTYVSSEFMDKLTEVGGVEKRTAMRGILKHEVGHYVDYPRECSKLMYIGHIAKNSFEKTHRTVLANWFDMMDNLYQIRCQERGKDVFEVYKGFSRMLEKRLQLSQEEQKLLRAIGKNPDEIIKPAREYSVDRLIYAYYQFQRGEDLGVKIEEGEYLHEKLKELKAIKYIKDEKEYGTLDKQEYDKQETVNFILFGQIITDVIKKLRENIPKISNYSQNKDSDKEGEDKDENGEDGEDNEDGSDGEGESGDDKEGKDGKGKGKGKGVKEDENKDKKGGKGSVDKDKDKEESKDNDNGNDDNGDEMSKSEKKRMLEDIIKRLTEPILKDTPDLRDFSDQQLNEGLNKIINQHGKFRYERVKNYF